MSAMIFFAIGLCGAGRESEVGARWTGVRGTRECEVGVVGRLIMFVG